MVILMGYMRLHVVHNRGRKGRVKLSVFVSRQHINQPCKQPVRVGSLEEKPYTLDILFKD